MDVETTEVEPIATMELTRTILWLSEESLSMQKDWPEEVQYVVDWSRRFVNWMRGEK